MALDVSSKKNVKEGGEQCKVIEQDIALLSRQIDEMDGKIRAYLGDRANKPHPRHLDLIAKIQGYRLPGGLGTAGKQLSVLLDNLQWKLHYHKQSWSQLWENAEAQKRQRATVVMEPSSDEAVGKSATAKSKSSASMERLWELQEEKLRLYGHTAGKESMADFKKRIDQEYRALQQKKKPSQEIVVTFSKEAGKCQLKLK